jgi:hypothetical protein
MLDFGGMVRKEKTADSQKEYLTHFVVYILSASYMPNIARHFPTVGKFKAIPSPIHGLETQLAV